MAAATSMAGQRIVRPGAGGNDRPRPRLELDPESHFSSASCSGLPALATCSFSPAIVAGDGTTTLTIQTARSKSAGLGAPGRAGLGLVFAGVLLWGVPRRRPRVSGMSLLLAALALGSAGCGRAANRRGGGPGHSHRQLHGHRDATTSDNVVSHAASFTLVVE